MLRQLEPEQAGATVAHAVAAATVARRLGSDPDGGLTEVEAARRLSAVGENVLDRREGVPRLRIAVRQFRDPLVALLAAAVALSTATGEVVDGVVIAAIICLNAALGYVQEAGAERAIHALREAVQPGAVVIRGGRERAIASAEVVPGDVLVIAEGDRIAADARVLDGDGLAVNESLLTGEPVPVEKDAAVADRDAPLAERASMVYAGTAVTRGQARAVVTGTGWATEIGRIGLLAGGARRPPTPLQRRLGWLSRLMVAGGLGVTVVLAAAMLGRGASLHDAFLVGVSVAVAAVPEGLAATITIALADGAHRMAGRRAIVRHLAAVETVGSATVIAADKTGTLTMNELRVAAVHAMPGRCADEVLAAAALATTARIVEGDAGPDIVGDPVDAAVLRAFRREGRNGTALPARLLVVPFSPERKRLTAAYREPGGIRVVVKGAPEVLAARACQQPADVDELLAMNRRHAAEGSRVLAVGAAMLPDPVPADLERLDEHIELLGLVVLDDPVREDAADSVRRALAAGLRVVMLTGDQPATALAVAGILGLPAGEAMTGTEVAAASDAELAAAVRTRTVFARVTPADKLRLVAALQAVGGVVVVTGDGVNDTPALRRADVGVAMGERGTESAREAADIVLTDDSFSTIVAAIEEGRRVAQNMRAFVTFLLSANAGEVLLFAAAILIGGAPPMTVVQVLTVNLLTDGLPALALARDPLSPETMAAGPRPRAGLVSLGGRRLGVVAGTVAAAAAAAYAVGSADGSATARTMAYATLALSEVLLVYSLRSLTLPAWRGPRNRELAAAVAGSGVLLAVTVYLPAAHGPMGTVALSAAAAAWVVGLALVPLAAAELWKRAATR